MAKGISAIIATILILLITVSISGMSFVFFSQTARTGQEATESEISQQTIALGTQVVVESASNGNVYLRNKGTQPVSLSGLAFYINGGSISATGPATLQPGELGTYVLDSAQLSSFPAVAELKVSTGIISDTFFGVLRNVIGTIISMGSTLTQGTIVVAQGTGIIFQNSVASPIATLVDAGDFGIGTTNPAAKLDVIGTSRTTNLLITGLLNCNGASTLDTDASGNVICGTDDNTGGGGGTAAGWSTTALTVYNDTANVNVSIGTSRAVGAKLVIQPPTTSAALMINNSQGIVYLSPDATGNGYVGSFTGGKFFALWAGAAEKMRIDSAGNVGIGTTTPTKLLTLFGGAPTLRFNDTNAPRVWDIQANSGANVGTLYFQDVTVGATRMVIDGAGNVGIGTTIPVAKLDVRGNLNVSGTGNFTNIQSSSLLNCDTIDTNAQGQMVCGFDASSGGSAPPAGWSISGLNVYNDTTGVNIGIGTAAPNSHLTIYDSGNTVAGQRIRIGSGAGSDYSMGRNPATGYLDFNGTQGVPNVGYTFATNNQIKVTIDSSGNLGIGTTTPAGLLAVSGGTNQFFIRLNDTANNNVLNAYLGGLAGGGTGASFGTFTNNQFRLTTNNLDRITIDTNGNVGIGTTSPAVKLDVAGTTRVTALQINGTLNCNTLSVLETDASGNVQCGTDDTSGGGGAPLGWSLSGANVYNNSAGTNVGIGTSTPGGRLTITGDASANNQFIRLENTEAANLRTWFLRLATTSSGAFTIFDNTASAERMRIDSSGNVGIGTTAPAQKLHVLGNSKFESGTMLVNASSVGGAAISLVDNAGNSGGVSILSPLNFGNTHRITLDQPNMRLHFENQNVDTGFGGGIKRDGALNTVMYSNFPTSGGGVRIEINGTTRLTVDSAGNVGIGTTTPSQKLTVIGNVNITGTLYAGNCVGCGYVLTKHQGSSNTLASTTYYMPDGQGTLQTTDDNSVGVIVPVAGTVTVMAIMTAVDGTIAVPNGLNVNWTLMLNGAPTGISVLQTFDATANPPNVVATGSVPVVAGDRLSVRMQTPAWTTAPTTVRPNFSILIQ